jgi:glycine C-acetyltransferase
MADYSFFESEIKRLKKAGIYKKIALLENEQGAKVKINNKVVINLSSNNYLGLISSKSIKQAAINYLKKFGTGTGSVRNIVGDTPIHRKLEKIIASFKKTEKAVLFQSGFMANVGLLNAILTENDAVFSDELNHASIIDGIRLSKAQKFIYPHANIEILEDLLKKSLKQNFQKRVIITDGVFSMNGDIAPLKEISMLAKKYNALTICDDAHATGVLGKNGEGSIKFFNIEKDWDIQVGTLSKAIGALGGFVAGKKSLGLFLEQKARPYLFSTSLPPAVVGAAIKAFQILKSKKGALLIKKLWDNTNYFKDNLKKVGFNIGASQTPITPIIIGDEKKTALFAKKAFDLKIFVQGFWYPVVPQGQARIRTIVTAKHTKKDLDEALEKLKFIGSKLKII